MHDLLIEQLIPLANAFRLSQQGFANTQYKQLLPQIHDCARQSTSVAAYVPILKKLMQAQERHDVLGIADTLQYELLPLLIQDRQMEVSR